MGFGGCNVWACIFSKLKNKLAFLTTPLHRQCACSELEKNIDLILTSSYHSESSILCPRIVTEVCSGNYTKSGTVTHIATFDCFRGFDSPARGNGSWKIAPRRGASKSNVMTNATCINLRHNVGAGSSRNRRALVHEIRCGKPHSDCDNASPITEILLAAQNN